MEENQCKPLISLEMYLKGREKQYPNEYTKEIEANAIELLKKVNAFLEELGIDKVEVTSGFRPLAINSNTKGAAKKSNHTICKAVDILDNKSQDLAEKCKKQMDLMIKYDLYMEDPNSTKGKYTNWVHLQNVAPKSGNRIFNP